MGDEQLKNYPHELVESVAKLIFLPLAKQKAKNFLIMFVLPALVVLLISFCLLRACCHCCCGRGTKIETTAMDQEMQEHEEGAEPKK